MEDVAFSFNKDCVDSAERGSYFRSYPTATRFELSFRELMRDASDYAIGGAEQSLDREEIKAICDLL
jgi:hypothetical protein